MASRYPVHKSFDYCLSPVRVSTSTGFSYVPCGKCSGCLVHKANVWSQRLSQEIDNSSHTLFFTLTYSNDFLPYLVKCCNVNDRKEYWISDHGSNYRHNGKIKVLRKDGICFIDSSFRSVPVTGLDGSVIPYVSRRDVQLFFKIVRKLLNDYGTTTDKFRSFLISEYGETLYRPHYHILLFCNDEALAKVLQSHILYEAWQMCDKDRFFEFCTFADSGASSYVTQYLTCNTLLPKVYQEVKELRPFRLSSKDPAIGYTKMVQPALEQINNGVIEYDRVIDRIDKRYILRYSSDFIASLFPKCARFGYSDFSRLLSVYGFLFNTVSRYNQIEGRAYWNFSDVLRSFMCPQDWRATYVCARVCKEQGWSTFHYVYTLDMVYYKMAMYALRTQYQAMEDNPLSLSWLGCYTNLPECVAEYRSHQLHSLSSFSEKYYLEYFFDSFGISPSDIVNLDVRDWFPEQYSQAYIDELHTIMEDMVKLPKFNELAGSAPNCSIV